jgi:hypothetical protein
MHWLGRVNFIWGDGFRFSHPLHHLGKTRADLPVLAVDSFRHMFDFGAWSDVDKDGILEVSGGATGVVLQCAVHSLLLRLATGIPGRL